jgi:hypothetical protein
MTGNDRGRGGWRYPRFNPDCRHDRAHQMYLLVWALFNPQNQKETLLALIVWCGPMAFWWIKSETVYDWMQNLRNRD